MGEMRSIFTEIYRQNGFYGSESISGPGASLASTERLRAILPEVFLSFGIRRMVDAPCGDMNWMRLLHYDFELFIGVDIVVEIIERLRCDPFLEKYHFQTADLCEDILPFGDAIFCRDCLPHLRYSRIKDAIRLFRLSSARFLFTTTFPEKENRELAEVGSWRPLNLQAPPFSWPTPMRLIRENLPADADPWNDKSLGVWSLVSLPD
jgi:hypothetical protein